MVQCFMFIVSENLNSGNICSLYDCMAVVVLLYSSLFLQTKRQNTFPSQPLVPLITNVLAFILRSVHKWGKRNKNNDFWINVTTEQTLTQMDIRFSEKKINFQLSMLSILDVFISLFSCFPNIQYILNQFQTKITTESEV